MLTQVPYSKPSLKKDCTPLWGQSHRTIGQYKTPSELGLPLYIDQTCPSGRVGALLAYLPHCEEVKKVGVDVSWLPALIEASASKLDINQMREFSSGFLDLIRKNEVETIDKILKQVINNNTSLETIVTCLRVNFSIRHKLSNWKIILNHSKNRVSDLGKDPKRVLSGLVA